MKKAPHVIPYQGSKRKLAEQILGHINFQVKGRLFDPFAGSGAITLAAASSYRFSSFVLGEIYEPLIELWRLIVASPEEVCTRYEEIWTAQLKDPRAHYKKIQREFNQDQDPVKFLYLVARCVKNAIKFTAKGAFLQTADHRRLGVKPARLAKQVEAASLLLKDRIVIRCGDFEETLFDAGPDDLVYLDPPWQGTSQKRNSRYACLLDFDKLVKSLQNLNERGIPFLLSFDGSLGEKTYGRQLPEHLELTRIGLMAGPSSQATLLGRQEQTVESLYLSPCFKKKADKVPGVQEDGSVAVHRSYL